jgi:hypothetical protein
MKNVIKFCVIFLTTSMFITSCGSSITLAKRQHNKGYYVSYNKKYSSSPNKQKVESNDETVNSKAVEVTVATQSVDANTTIVSNQTAPANYEEPISPSVEKTPASENKVEKTTTNKPRTIKEVKNKIKTAITSSEDAESSEGYSLLWIIIIVLLILWALGLIGGIGTTGLIHILLVIALILLILWLLKVV